MNLFFTMIHGKFMLQDPKCQVIRPQFDKKQATAYCIQGLFMLIYIDNIMAFSVVFGRSYYDQRKDGKNGRQQFRCPRNV